MRGKWSTFLRGFQKKEDTQMDFQSGQQLPLTNAPRWRHEWKYVLNVSDALAIHSRLLTVAEPDPHAGFDGKYRIRSLYFDNYQDKALYEKLNGTNCREKFRIRYYNHDTVMMHLEKKYKKGGVGMKFSEAVSRETVTSILYTRDEWISAVLFGMREEEKWPKKLTLIEELAEKMQTEGLRPKVLVDYTREPFQFDAGNVRVTLDYNLRTSWKPEDFLNPFCDTISAGYPPRELGDVLQASNGWQKLDFERELWGLHSELPLDTSPVLLEVKWDNFLPDIIRDAIQCPGLSATAFSKYAQSRMYP